MHTPTVRSTVPPGLPPRPPSRQPLLPRPSTPPAPPAPPAPPPPHHSLHARAPSPLPLHAPSPLIEGRSSSFSGEASQGMGSDSSRAELSSTGTVARASSKSAQSSATPCFSCGKPDVGSPCYRPSNPAWVTIAIVCLDGACADLWRCSSRAKICKQAPAYSSYDSPCVIRRVSSDP